MLIIEGPSLCVIQWASQASYPPWFLADIIEEVFEITKTLNVSFHHIKHSANTEEDRLAKEGASKPSLLISSV